ncbi:hypothetical protein GF373_00220 [bacterium]|nr:hypothetical protein [bacterium]
MKKDFLALAMVGSVICAFCYETLLFGMSPFQGDIPLQFYPWKSYAKEMLGQGIIPYWNPYTYGGAPFLANMQSAVFYPLDLLLLLFPMEHFFGYSLLLHFILGGTGAFLLARVCGASPFPSMIAGIAYGLNGFAMIHIPAGNHYTYAGAAWVPWVFMTAVGFMRCQGSRLPWALGAAFVAFMHFLCGHPQMMFYSLFFSLLLALVLGIWEIKRVEHGSAQVPIVRAFVLACFLCLGVFMAGMQLIPTLEYVLSASRATSIDLQAATEFSFAPHRLITLLFPEFFGTRVDVFTVWNHYDSFVYWSCAYAGIIVPFLGIQLLFRKNKPITAVPLAGIALLALLFAWGRGNPFYALIYQLPGFGHFRAPAKYLPYYLVPICTLAALGVESLAQTAKHNLKGKEKDFWFWGAALGAGFVIATILATQLPRFYELVRESSVEEVGIIRTWSVLIGFLLALAGFVMYILSSKVPKYTTGLMSLALGFVLIIDLFAYGRIYYETPLKTEGEIRRYEHIPNEINRVRSPLLSKIPERVVNLRDVYYPNVFILWKRATIAGYDPLSLQSYNDLIGRMEGWEVGSFHDDIRLTKYDHPVLDMLNVKYVITQKEIVDKTVRPVSAGNQFRVYERISPNRGWAFAKDGEKWVCVDSSIHGEVYQPHEIVFAYKNTHQTMLRLAEWAYPGWHAFAGKQKIPIKKSQNGFRLLTIPSGENIIKMEYVRPMVGWLLSYGSWLIFLVLNSLIYLKRTDTFWLYTARVFGRK